MDQNISSPAAVAAQLAATASDKIAASPSDPALHRQILYDLSTDLVQTCARAWSGDKPIPQTLLDGLTRNLPEFSTASLYTTRTPPMTLAILVLAGFFLGGLASSLLDFVSLGGEVIRVATVWAVLQFSDLLAARPGLRRGLLAVLGLGALIPFVGRLLTGQFATGLAGGGLARAILGKAAPMGFLRRYWLLAGGSVLFLLCRRKLTGLDLAAFGPDLEKQIAQRIRLVQAYVDDLEQYAILTGPAIGMAEEKAAENGPCRRRDCSLALGLAELLPGLPDSPAAYLARRMTEMGFVTPPLAKAPEDERQGGAVAPDDETDKALTIVWRAEDHAHLYETVGLVRDGDTCIVLEQPCQTGDKVRKGHVQKI